MAVETINGGTTPDGENFQDVDCVTENDVEEKLNDVQENTVEGIRMHVAVDVNGVIDSSVENLLISTIKNSGFANLKDQELDELLDSQRLRFDEIFDGKLNYVDEEKVDARIIKLKRVYDYCSRVGFDWQEFFNVKSPDPRKPEQAIAMFRNFFRITMLKLCQKIKEPTLLAQMKISAVTSVEENGLNHVANILAERLSVSSKQRVDEVRAILVMLRHGIID